MESDLDTLSTSRTRLALQGMAPMAAWDAQVHQMSASAHQLLLNRQWVVHPQNARSVHQWDWMSRKGASTVVAMEAGESAAAVGGALAAAAAAAAMVRTAAGLDTLTAHQ